MGFIESSIGDGSIILEVLRKLDFEELMKYLFLVLNVINIFYCIFWLNSIDFMLLDNLSLIDDFEYSFVFFVSGDSGVELGENG